MKFPIGDAPTIRRLGIGREGGGVLPGIKFILSLLGLFSLVFVLILHFHAHHACDSEIW